jgi:hypothetical protein
VVGTKEESAKRHFRHAGVEIEVSDGEFLKGGVYRGIYTCWCKQRERLKATQGLICF